MYYRTRVNKKEIIGRLITLQQLQPDFFDDYHTMFSPMVRHVLHLPEHQTVEQTRQFLHDQCIKHQLGQTLFYCIFDNVDHRLIGGIEIRQNDPEKGQLGNWLNERYWGAGRYQEALNLIVQEYFRLHSEKSSISAYVDISNERSHHALKKYGFIQQDTRKGPHESQRVMLLMKNPQFMRRLAMLR